MGNKGSLHTVEMEMAVPEAKNRRRDPNRKRSETTMSDGLSEEAIGETHPENNHTSLE